MKSITVTHFLEGRVTFRLFSCCCFCCYTWNSKTEAVYRSTCSHMTYVLSSALAIPQAISLTATWTYSSTSHSISVTSVTSPQESPKNGPLANSSARPGKPHTPIYENFSSFDLRLTDVQSTDQS